MRKAQQETDQKKKIAPKGHFVVYVGQEQKRYFVPLSYLRNATFLQLMEIAAEEYGFDYSQQNIHLPCNVSFFDATIEFLARS